MLFVASVIAIWMAVETFAIVARRVVA